MRHFLFNCFVLSAMIVAALLVQTVLGVQTRIDQAAFAYQGKFDEEISLTGNWVDPSVLHPVFAKASITCDTKKKRCTEKMQRFVLKGLRLVHDKPVRTLYKITRNDREKLLARAGKIDIAVDKNAQLVSKTEDKQTTQQMVDRRRLKTILYRAWFLNRLAVWQRRIGL